MSAGVELSIILPTLNEAENVGSMIERIDDALTGIAWEAIIIDDDSADGTADRARDLAREDARLRVIQRIGRRGLSSAVIEGFGAAAAPHVAVMDCDHQHDPALLPAMLRTLRQGDADFCIASRFARGASTAGWNAPGRKRLSGWGNALARTVIGRGLSDPMSGYFMLSSARARSIAPHLSGIGFKIALDILAAAGPQMRVQEFPLCFGERRKGESKLDQGVVFDFLVGLFDRKAGRAIPTRLAVLAVIAAPGITIAMAVVVALYGAYHFDFAIAQLVAAVFALSADYVVFTALTYRSERPDGARGIAGHAAIFAACAAIGIAANVTFAVLIHAAGMSWPIAALSGIVVGAAWNFLVPGRNILARY